MRKTILRALSALVSFGAVSNPSQAGDTLIREPEFHLTLPGQWSGGYDVSSHAWTYINASRKESVTVGILERTADASPSEVRTDFDDYLRVRREQEQRVGGSKLVLSKPSTAVVRDAVTAKYDGYDSSNGRRTYTRVIVNGKVAASFYYEAWDLSEREFTNRAVEILGKVGLVH